MEGAAHVIYQIWPLNKTEALNNLFGGKRISKWDKIVWDNKSIISTSHSELKLSQTKAGSWPIIQAGDATGREPNNVFESKISSGAEKLPAAGRFDSTSPIKQAVRKYVAEVQATSNSPGSFGDNNSWRQEKPLACESHPSSMRIDHQLDRKTDFNDMEVFLEFELSPRPVYTIERCRKPQSLLDLPIVNIDQVLSPRSVQVYIYIFTSYG